MPIHTQKTSSATETILSSFLFQVSPHNRRRAIFASESVGIAATSLRLLVQVWKHRREASTLLVEGVVPQMAVAILQKYLPGCRMRVLVTECLWEREPATLRGRLKNALLRWMILHSDRCILYAQADVARFADYYRVPPSRFATVRFHNTLRPERYPIVDAQGGYIFAGGNSDRDYPALINAMRGIDAVCLIACSPWLLQGIKLPSNVCRVDADHLQFRQLMAGAAIVVLPMSSRPLRSAGQQTFLNAMKLGKVVIVTDPQGAADYIVDGTNGILCSPADLGTAIRGCLENPERAREIGREAKKAGAACTVESTYDSIFDVADELHRSSPALAGAMGLSHWNRSTPGD